MSRRALVVSHLMALALGGALAGVLTGSSLSGAKQLGPWFERQPLTEAAHFAYAWGSESDASALLSQYEAYLRSAPDADPLLGPSELVATGFQRAIVERKSDSELLELCRSTAKCKPEKLDALVEMIAAKRKVNSP